MQLWQPFKPAYQSINDSTVVLENKAEGRPKPRIEAETRESISLERSNDNRLRTKTEGNKSGYNDSNCIDLRLIEEKEPIKR